MRKHLLLTLALLFSILGGAFAQTTSAILASSTNETTPEYQYKVQTRSDNFWWSSSTTTSNNIENAGKFAFFDAEGEGNYYIYSVDEHKWVSYNKAEAYSDGRDFVTLVEEKASANYFKFVKGVSTADNASNDKTGYTISPYCNNGQAAVRYLNWYEGASSQTSTQKVGIYGTQWSDAGSVWILTPADDATKTKSVDLWREEIATYNNIVGLGYSSADYASTENLTFDEILTWKANHSVLAFDATKYYRVYNYSRHNANYAWSATATNGETKPYDASELKQIWKFIPVEGDASKYYIYNLKQDKYLGAVTGGGGNVQLVTDNPTAYIMSVNSDNIRYKFYHTSQAERNTLYIDTDDRLDGWANNNFEYFYLELLDNVVEVESGATGDLSALENKVIVVNTNASLDINTDNADLAKIFFKSNSTAIISNTTIDISSITGNVNVTINVENYPFNDNKQTVATGKLTINSGKKLTIGSGENTTNSVASFTSVLVNGTLWHNNKNGVLHDVTLDNGIVHSEDMNTPGSDTDAATGTFTNALVFEGTTTITGNSFILAGWNAQYDIKKLAGNGTLNIRGNGTNATTTTQNQPMYIAIREVDESITAALDVYNTDARLVIANGVHIKNNLRANAANVSNIKFVGNQRINTQGNITIDGIVANDLTAGSYNYAIVEGSTTTLNLKGNVDLCHNSNGDANTFNMIGYQAASRINILENANIQCGGVYWSPNSTTSNAPINIATGAVLATNNNAIIGNSIENNGSIKLDKTSFSGAFVNTSSITGDNFNVILTNEALNALSAGSYTVISCSGDNSATNITVNGNSEFTLGTSHYTIAKDGNNIKLTKSIDEIADLIIKVDNAVNAIFSDKVGYPNRYISENNDAITSLAEYRTINPKLGSPIKQENYQDALAKYNAVLALTAINLPVDGKAYTISAKYSGGIDKLYYDATAERIRGTENPTENYIWICKQVVPGKFILVNGLGQYLIWGASQSVSGIHSKAFTDTYSNLADITIAKANVNTSGSGTKATSDQLFGCVTLQGLRDGTQDLWYSNYKHDDNNTFVEQISSQTWYDSDNNNRTHMYIFEEASYPYNTANLQTVSGANYSTIYLPFAMTIPAGVKAYGVTGTSKKGEQAVMILNKVADGEQDTDVPAGGYLLYSETKSGSTTILPAASNPATVDNEFTGSTTTGATLPTGTKWVLGKKSGIGFYKYTGATYPLGKAIYVSESQSARLAFSFEDIETAIQAVENGANADIEIYDLAGRRVQKATKGLYIINGKKVMVK